MIPIRPRLSSKEAQRVADYVNRKLANNPSEVQQLMFGFIADDLGLDEDTVRGAISDGGYNGITIRVTAGERYALAGYKDAPTPD
jgi:hypothetical protein